MYKFFLLVKFIFRELQLFCLWNQLKMSEVELTKTEETIKLSPFQKLIKRKKFPFKLVVHTLIALLVTAEVKNFF